MNNIIQLPPQTLHLSPLAKQTYPTGPGSIAGRLAQLLAPVSLILKSAQTSLMACLQLYRAGASDLRRSKYQFGLFPKRVLKYGETSVINVNITTSIWQAVLQQAQRHSMCLDTTLINLFVQHIIGIPIYLSQM